MTSVFFFMSVLTASYTVLDGVPRVLCSFCRRRTLLHRHYTASTRLLHDHYALFLPRAVNALKILISSGSYGEPSFLRRSWNQTSGSGAPSFDPHG